MNVYDQFGLEASTSVKVRNIKFLFWGNTATRKTETVLRNFPRVLMIDAEGNSDQCVDMPEIPPFLRIKTKDQRKVLEILERVAKGEIKFLDGNPVETVCIDSASVIWSVQQEVAGKLAEKRAIRFKKSPDEAAPTFRDWGSAKRPMKQMANFMNASPIKYFILIGREKILYKDNGGDENAPLVRIGYQADVMKGTEYEVSCNLHFLYDENGKWVAEVIKAQGSLSKIFPMAKRLSTFPIDEVKQYAAHLTGQASTEKSEDVISDEIAEELANQEVPHTQKDLIDYAKQRGIEPADLGKLLKDNGFAGFDPKHWAEMIEVVDEAEKVPEAVQTINQ